MSSKTSIEEMEPNNTNFVEVELPKEFCEMYDEDTLYMIFSNESCSSGGEINEEKSMFNKRARKALICYVDENKAEVVANRKLIKFKDFSLNVKLVKMIESTSKVNNFNYNQSVRQDATKSYQEDIYKHKADNRSKDYLKSIKDLSRSIESSNFGDLRDEISESFNYEVRKENPRMPIPSDIVKNLSSYSILSILIDKRNLQWKSKLEYMLCSNNASLRFENQTMTIKCKIDRKSKNYEALCFDWEKRVDSIIQSFTSEFNMDLILTSNVDLAFFKETLDQFNTRTNGINVAYRVFRDEIVYVANNFHFDKFRIFLKSNLENRIKETFFPLLNLFSAENSDVIQQLVESLKLQNKELEILNYSNFDHELQLKGPSKLVDEIINEFTELSKTIHCDRLISISEDATNCEDTINILERIRREKNLLCKVHKKEKGFYLTYFQTNSQNDDALIQLENFLFLNYTTLRKNFGLTSTESLNMQKWSEFQTNNLIGNPTITFKLINSNREIIIFGKKESVLELDTKINEFLEHNKQISNQKLNLKQEDVGVYIESVEFIILIFFRFFSRSYS